MYYHCTKRKDPNCTEKYVNETDMQEQIKEYVIGHAPGIKVSYQIQKAIADHQKVLLYHLPKYGVSTASIQPLASYADYVLSSSNAKLIAELIEGIQTKFALRNGSVVKC